MYLLLTLDEKTFFSFTLHKFRHWNWPPGDMVITPRLPELRKCLDNAFRYNVWFLSSPVQRQQLDLMILCWSFPTQDILYIYDTTVLSSGMVCPKSLLRLPHWRSLKAIWTLSCLSRGVRSDHLQRSLPTSSILWFCERNNILQEFVYFFICFWCFSSQHHRKRSYHSVFLIQPWKRVLSYKSFPMKSCPKIYGTWSR